MLWCLAPDLSGRRQTPSRRSAAEQYQRLATQLEPAAGPISFSIALVKGHLREYRRLVARRATYDHKKRRTRPVLFWAAGFAKLLEKKAFCLVGAPGLEPGTR